MGYPNFGLLWLNHPHYGGGSDGILSVVNDNFSSQIKGLSPCCIQLSYALNNSGSLVEGFGRTIAKGVRDGDRIFNDFYHRYLDDHYMRDGNMFYLIEVSDMIRYLNIKFGFSTPKGLNMEKADMIDAAGIAGKQGIITFGHYHIELWCDNTIHWPDSTDRGVSMNSCFQQAKKRGIRFWEIP